MLFQYKNLLPKKGCAKSELLATVYGTQNCHFAYQQFQIIQRIKINKLFNTMTTPLVCVNTFKI